MSIKKNITLTEWLQTPKPSSVAAGGQCSAHGKSWLSRQSRCWLPAYSCLVKLTQLKLQVFSRLAKAKRVQTTVTRPGAL